MEDLARLIVWATEGGPVAILLIGVSALSITLIIIALWRVAPSYFGRARRARALEAWRRGDAMAARAGLLSGGGPVDRVGVGMMDALARGAPPEEIKAMMTRCGAAEMSAMSGQLRALEAIAALSPLLGLLGTVLGMIVAFQELELAKGAANAALLAGGIWQALLTTALGLIAAIPAGAAAGWVAARTERVAQEIEAFAHELRVGA